MSGLLRLIFGLIVDLFRSRAALEAEILASAADHRAAVFIRRIRSLDIRDHPISPRSPWQNGYAERLIGSIRRECLDHVVVFGERHLPHVLSCHIDYYNAARTHLSLDKDTPVQAARASAAIPVHH